MLTEIRSLCEVISSRGGRASGGVRGSHGRGDRPDDSRLSSPRLAV